MKPFTHALCALVLAAMTLAAVSCNKTVPVSRLTLSRTSLSMTEGEEVSLTVTVVPEDASDKSVTWSTSDAKVATVSNGKVHAVAPGSATITATTVDGGKTASCAVTVNRRPVPVTSVALDKTSLDMLVGEEATLAATVVPADADDKSVTWNSDNTDVATVSDGKVSAVGVGTATITATTFDGGKTASCAVTVTEPAPGAISFVKMEAEELKSMSRARADHALFVTANGEIVAAGGHGNSFKVLSHAEYYKDGEWHDLPNMNAAHDMAFSVALADGRFLIGGGCPSSGGSGQSEEVDVYDFSAKTFAAFSSLSTSRAMPHAAAVGNKIVVSGNWYNSDGIEAWGVDDNDAFSSVKGVSQTRCHPYIFQTAADNAMVFAPNDTRGNQFSTVTVDRYNGDSFTPALFETWRPMYVGTNWRPADCSIGDYQYLIMVTKKDAPNNQGGAVALVNGEDISLLPADCAIPADSEYGKINFAGPVLTDRSKKVAYAFGCTGTASDVVCFILKIDYADAFSGGKAKLKMYYTDPIASFPAGQSGIVLMPDGRVMVAGGIYNSNYSPFSSVYAFKPF